MDAKMHILITGGAGFIGSHLAQKLIRKKHRVIIADNLNDYYRPQLKKDRLKVLLGGLPYKFYKADIADYGQMRRIFKKHRIDVICHQAAQAGVRYSLQKPFIYEATNIRGTLNLLELAREFGINRFVFASSSSVYGDSRKFPLREDMSGDPASFYGATKKASEDIIRVYHKLYGIRATCLRYFSVYGPWGRPDMAYFSFTRNILAGKPITLYNFGKMRRDFTYVDDIVDGVLRAIHKNYPWAVINLGSGRPIDLGTMVRALEDSLGRKAKVKYLPLQPGDVIRTGASNSKARKLLGWKPEVGYKEGIAKFTEWYKEYYVQHRWNH